MEWWVGGCTAGKFSRTWVDSSGKFRKNQLALPMLAMETEMKTQPTPHGGIGFTRMELLVVICVVVAVMAALLLPALTAAKTKS
jgi:type II secretory pathway pseudopilin PulG